MLVLVVEVAQRDAHAVLNLAQEGGLGVARADLRDDHAHAVRHRRVVEVIQPAVRRAA